MYDIIQSSLEATGLASTYMQQFKHNRMTDSVVKTFIKFPSLKQNLAKVIPDEEHLTKFIEAFHRQLDHIAQTPASGSGPGPGVSIASGNDVRRERERVPNTAGQKNPVPVPTVVSTPDCKIEAGPELKPKPTPRTRTVVQTEIKLETEPKPNKTPTSLSSSSRNNGIDVESLLTDLKPPEKSQEPSRYTGSSTSFGYGPRYNRKRAEITDQNTNVDAALPEIQNNSRAKNFHLPVFRNDSRSNIVTHLSEIRNENHSKLAAPLPEIHSGIVETKTDSNFTNSHSPVELKEAQVPKHAPTTERQELKDQSETTRWKITPGEQPDKDTVKNPTHVSQLPTGEPERERQRLRSLNTLPQRLTATKPSSSYEQRKSDEKVKACLKIYEQTMLAQQNKIRQRRPFALTSELSQIHETAQEASLSSLREEKEQSNQTLTESRNFDKIQKELLHCIKRCFALATAENSNLQTETILGAALKLEIYVSSLMEEKIARLCGPDPNSFLQEDAFLTVYEECETSSRDFFKQLLSLDADLEGNADTELDALPLAQKQFQKTLHTLRESLHLQNKVKALEAELRLKDTIKQLSSSYRNTLGEKCRKCKYWTEEQLKEVESSVRSSVLKDSSNYPKNSEQLLKLEKEFDEAFENVKKTVGVENDRYLVSLSKVLAQAVNSYTKKILKLEKNPKEKSGTIQIWMAHVDEKARCLNILKGNPDFDRLPGEEADRFTQELETSIDKMFEQIVPVTNV